VPFPVPSADRDREQVMVEALGHSVVSIAATSRRTNQIAWGTCSSMLGGMPT
jgi:hypothetical protein